MISFFAIQWIFLSMCVMRTVATIQAHLSERDVFAKTVYAEARGEPVEGQVWVAWVIKNRARMNRGYWGGNTIKGVCLKKGQFECWNGKSDIDVSGEPQVYQRIHRLTDAIYVAPPGNDPSGGADHYNNPDKEGYPPWTKNCKRLRKIGHHQFYKGP
uniref:Cell wall hydrolase SleB domain-containing protein n=1 Tax=Plectus sambesii TaxID=2011161 RepID=A0A914W970_9BILA